ncbi:MAG: FkbM family methyltransferase [Planctomycetaceae bacterium]|nr:FkbM family methyltransferase [Planctomycetaceae bacterium]
MPQKLTLIRGRTPRTQSRLKSALVDLLHRKSVGTSAAVLTGLAGAKDLSRKISTLCGYVPLTVEVHLPNHLSGRCFLMNGAQGLDPVSRSLWWGGWAGYERPFPDLFAACSQSSRCVLDVGSFSGLYSMIAAICSPEAKVFAFEPYPNARALLEANLRSNRLVNHIQIVPVAASDHAGEADLYVPTTTTGLIESASSLNSQIYDATLDRIIVTLTTLDSFIAERKVGPVDLMKIDVETYEPQVLRGGARMLREDRPVIFLEILPAADADALDTIRREFDYLDGILLEEGVLWQDPVRNREGRNDHVFCPREKRDWLQQRVELAGYRVTGSA